MKSTTHEINGISVLALDGRFDAHTVSQVKDWISTHKRDQAVLVIDLANVSFVDSAALAALVQGMKQCRELGGDLRLCQLAQPVRIIFELTRLDRAFSVYDNLQAAVGDAQPSQAVAG